MHPWTFVQNITSTFTLQLLKRIKKELPSSQSQGTHVDFLHHIYFLNFKQPTDK